MRISDWSSDVCFSDLDCSSASYDGNGQERERQARHVLPEIEVSKTLHRLSPSKKALSCEAERDAKAVQQMIRTATGLPLSQRRQVVGVLAASRYFRAPLIRSDCCVSFRRGLGEASGPARARETRGRALSSRDQAPPAGRTLGLREELCRLTICHFPFSDRKSVG